MTAAARLRSQRAKVTGTVSVSEPSLTLGGGAGTGLARRGSETASESYVPIPDERISRDDTTRPERSMVNAICAVPLPPAPGGKRLWRLRWAIIAPRQLAGDCELLCDVLANGAAVRSARCARD